ncbi:YppG family protein [Halalkalibacter krulwichiae]|uniref:YppG-like protein n=1 Tax=Halalkalibacter krulwichiae TaxID=199441 RepID=A0A1X9MBL5_9BACI|nr:YppG family protein [Halalkalibacter krulwichiae]ARK30817.1 hypothetical protein BkAM31D_13755 [Halalkalibacter krulwichiae]
MFQPNYQRPMNPHYPHPQSSFQQRHYVNQRPTQMQRFLPQQQQKPLQTPNRHMGPQQFQGYKPSKASFLKAAFTNENGTFDMNKTVNTVDQVMKAVNQVSPIVKQVSSFFTKK